MRLKLSEKSSCGRRRLKEAHQLLRLPRSEHARHGRRPGGASGSIVQASCSRPAWSACRTGPSVVFAGAPISPRSTSVASRRWKRGYSAPCRPAAHRLTSCLDRARDALAVLRTEDTSVRRMRHVERALQQRELFLVVGASGFHLTQAWTALGLDVNPETRAAFSLRYTARMAERVKAAVRRTRCCCSEPRSCPTTVRAGPYQLKFDGLSGHRVQDRGAKCRCGRATTTTSPIAIARSRRARESARRHGDRRRDRSAR
jgi:hypothetical protein